MTIRRTFCLLAALCLGLLAAAPAHALDVTALRAKLTKETGLLGSAASAEVVDLGSGTVLFSRRPTLELVPASNEKLFTTATALLLFGPEARRETRVLGELAEDRDGDVEVAGDLYLVGAGDPTFSNADLTGLADELVRTRGIREVEGGVVGDESLLDQRRGSVDSGFRPDLDLGGQLGALVVGRGATDGTSPARLVASRLQAMLTSRGVRFTRRARTGRAPAALTGTGEALAVDVSPPMAELARLVNQPSDNFASELLLKVIGADAGTEGSTAAGAAVVRRTLADVGLRPTIADGSGLSRQNRASARQVLTLLQAMRAGPASAAWLRSMTVAGRNGTLRRRMRGTAAAGRCSGKTGTLRGVSALSGYCTTTAGRRLAFSFLANGVGSGAKAVEDRMVAALARYER